MSYYIIIYLAIGAGSGVAFDELVEDENARKMNRFEYIMFILGSSIMAFATFPIALGIYIHKKYDKSKLQQWLNEEIK